MYHSIWKTNIVRPLESQVWQKATSLSAASCCCWVVVLAWYWVWRRGNFSDDYFWCISERNLGWLIYIYIYIGLSPLPVIVTTRIITFLVGNPELNLHLPLLLGGGTTQYIYISDQKEHDGKASYCKSWGLSWGLFQVYIYVYIITGCQYMWTIWRKNWPVIFLLDPIENTYCIWPMANLLNFWGFHI